MVDVRQQRSAELVRCGKLEIVPPTAQHFAIEMF